MAVKADAPVLERERTRPARVPAAARPKRKRSRAEQMAMRRKKAVTRWHRRASLVLGIWLLLQGASGIVMMLDDQLAQLTHPGIYDSGDGDQGPAAAVAAARAAVPDAKFDAGVVLPAASRGVYRVAMVVDPTTFEQRIVYVDPATAGVNAVRDLDEGAAAFAARWHDSLLQDEKILGVEPDQVVGLLGAATLFVVVSGLVLWYWPRVQRWKRLRRVRIGNGKYTFGLDLHLFIGVLTTPLVLMLLVTGLNLAFPRQLRAAWYAATPGSDDGERADGYLSKVPPPKSEVPADGARPLAATDHIAAARQLFPGAEIVSVRAGGAPDAAAQVKLSSGWDPYRGPVARGGNVTVFFDKYAGRLLRVNQPSQKSLSGQVYEYWSFPAHTGTFAGSPGRLLWFVGSAAPIVLMASGLLTMQVRRSKRRRRERCVAAALPGLTRAEVRETATHAAARSVRAGDLLAKQGDNADSFFVVVRGTLDVFHEAEDGTHRRLKQLAPGDHFGEIALVRGGPRSATVEATTDGELLALDRAGFEKLVASSAAARSQLEEVTAQRLAEQGPGPAGTSADGRPGSSA